MTSQRSCQRTPEEQITFLLKRLMHQFRHQVDERLRRSSDLSFAHLVTLDQLQQEPGVAGARLARSLLVTAQTDVASGVASNPGGQALLSAMAVW